MADVRERCWRCGYDLRASAGPRCPECGQEFDRADPRSLHHGVGPIGKISRRLLKPVGWWAVAAGAIATLALVAVTGWPGTFSFRVLEWRYYFAGAWTNRHAFISQTVPQRWTGAVEWSYLAAILVWALLLIYVPLRMGMRQLLLWRHRVPVKHRMSARRRMGIWVLLLAVAVAWQGFGWPNRLAAHFARQELALKPNLADRLMTDEDDPTICLLKPYTELTDGDRLEIEKYGIARLSSPRQRTAMLAIIACNDTDSAADVILPLLEREPDRQVRLTMLEMLALSGDMRCLGPLVRLLDSPDSVERGAAVDAIGILRDDAPFLPYAHVQQAIASDPPIREQWLLANRDENRERFDAVVKSSPWPDLRGRIWKIARSAPTELERQAARRALVRWQEPGSHLRLAEWGVWLADGADITLAKSVIDGLPPFVHDVGNSAASAEDKLIVTHGGPSWPGVVTKPIIHLTSSRAMCVNVDVGIAFGRPWYVYPMPSDFSFLESPNYVELEDLDVPDSRKLSQLDPPSTLKPLGDLDSGVPWLVPHRYRPRLYDARDPELIDFWGVLWEGLLVTPTLEPGMKLADVPKDAKYAWWQRLREVPSCYVTNRGETERFLYYDGPTNLCVPVKMAMRGGFLTARFPAEIHLGMGMKLNPEAKAEDFLALPSSSDYDGLYVEVADGKARGEKVRLLRMQRREQSLTLPALGDDAPGQLRAMLAKAGLTKEEAEGLMTSWQEAFFKTPGRRFLLFLDPDDYDILCPLRIEPEPSQRVRVGILLTELDAGK